MVPASCLLQVRDENVPAPGELAWTCLKHQQKISLFFLHQPSFPNQFTTLHFHYIPSHLISTAMQILLSLDFWVLFFIELSPFVQVISVLFIAWLDICFFCPYYCSLPRIFHFPYIYVLFSFHSLLSIQSLFHLVFPFSLVVPLQVINTCSANKLRRAFDVHSSQVLLLKMNYGIVAAAARGCHWSEGFCCAKHCEGTLVWLVVVTMHFVVWRSSRFQKAWTPKGTKFNHLKCDSEK